MKESILKELETMVEARAKKLVQKDLQYKDKWDHAKFELSKMVQEAEHLKEDMDKNALTFSGIEAEGYLRFAISVKSLLEYLE